MSEPADLPFLLLLGTWAALDGTAFGQVLISRPLVSATLAGWILGDPTTGLLVGILLEGAHLGELPIGGARLPEPGPAGVGAAAAAIWVGGAGGLALGIALGVSMSLLGGLTVSAQRRLNGRLTRAPTVGWKRPGQLSLRHWSCILIDSGRGAALTGLGVGLALAIPGSLGDRWPLAFPSTIGLLSLPAFLSGGALIRRWRAASGVPALLALGCAAGALVGLLA